LPVLGRNNRDIRRLIGGGVPTSGHVAEHEIGSWSGDGGRVRIDVDRVLFRRVPRCDRVNIFCHDQGAGCLERKLYEARLDIIAIIALSYYRARTEKLTIFGSHAELRAKFVPAGVDVITGERADPQGALSLCLNRRACTEAGGEHEHQDCE
jgi:hypothetical protein